MGCSKKDQYWGIFTLFIAGALLHSLIDLFSGLPILQTLVGLIAPVNESIWEHGKLTLFPLIVWWIVSYQIGAKKEAISPKRWFTGGLVSLLICLVLIPMCYYFYTGAFGIKSVAVDILILLLALTLGQLAGYHVVDHKSGLPLWILFVVTLVLVVVFAIFTFFPPSLPWFLSLG